jgi:hypothetical protein
VAPDTNALIFNPDLEKWKLDGTPQFTMVLIPAVLSELDSLKVNHRVETVREKAEKVISRIKDYRRRAAAAGGRLADGAVVVTGVSTLSPLLSNRKWKHLYHGWIRQVRTPRSWPL